MSHGQGRSSSSRRSAGRQVESDERLLGKTRLITRTVCIHDRKPFTFDVAGVTVVILPSAGGDDADGFLAQTRVQAEALLLAERAAHDALTALLDVLCYEMRVSGLVVRSVRSQVEGSGPVRRCMVYGHEPHQRSLFLMDKQAEEVQRILRDQPHKDIQRALYWLRWSYNARTVPEAFLFAWMALERLAGEQRVPARCSKCGELTRCPKHGEQYYSSVPRAEIKAILERRGVANAMVLQKLRNPLVHGSLEHSFEHREIIKRTLPDLVRAIEEELRTRLEATQALHISPLNSPGDSVVLGHCEYRTEFPDEPFPPDCPTFVEVEKYQETFKKGNQHPKIINLLPSHTAKW
jgi:hypothetical protein